MRLIFQRSTLPVVIWLALLTGLVLTTTVLVLAGNAGATAVIEILRIVASWPVVIFVLALGFGLHFHVQLGAVVERVSEFWMPGVGFRANASPPQEPAAPEATAIEAPGETVDKSAEQSSVVPTQTTLLTDEQIASLRDELLRQQRLRVLWFMYYQSLALTQPQIAILRWLTWSQGAGAATEYSVFEENLGKSIPNSAERRAALDALKQSGWVTEVGTAIYVTEWGRRFVAFLAGAFRPLFDYPGDPPPTAQGTTAATG